MSPPRKRAAFVAAIAGLLLSPATLTVSGTAATAAPAAPAEPRPTSVVWEADPARGTSVFQSLERAPGNITVADDPQGRHGRSFRYETWDHDVKERCESKGHRRPDGSVFSFDRPGETYYVGWRSLWDPMPTPRGRWVAFWQIHHYGYGPGGGPLALRTLGDGQLHLQYTAPGGNDRHIWSAPLRLGTWNSFVVGFRVSRSESDGWLEFWYNGVQQRLSNGSTRIPAALLWPGADYVTNKWGVYRSHPVNGRASAYLNRARVGTSYADVAL